MKLLCMMRGESWTLILLSIVAVKAGCSIDGFCDSDDSSLQSPPADAILRIRCVYGSTNTNQSLISSCCKVSFSVLVQEKSLLSHSPDSWSFVSKRSVASGVTGKIRDIKVDIYEYVIEPTAAQTGIANLPASALPTLCLTVVGTRCLKLFLVTDPYEVEVPGYFKASDDWQTRPSQAPTILTLQSGVTYTFIVVAKHQFPEDPLQIELRGWECSIDTSADAPPCPSPELPNMMWLGPTTCFKSGGGVCNFTNVNALTQQCTDEKPYDCLSNTAAGGTPDQRNWNWYRKLQYTPRGVEVGNVYKIAFQAFAPGVFADGNQNAKIRTFSGLSLTPPPSLRNGLLTRVSDVFQCQGNVVSFAESRSPFSPPVFGYHEFQIVQRNTFGFDYAQQTQEIYTREGQPFRPSRQSALPVDPELNITVYINCPTRIGYYSKQSDSEVSMLSGTGGFAGIQFESNMMYSCGSDQLCPYAELSWTPTPEYAGKTAQLCLRAQTIGDASSFQDSCVIYQVARCIVCSRAGDSLKSISAFYGTSWLQVWSVNDHNVDVLKMQEQYLNRTGSRSGGEQGVSLWKTPKIPQELQSGRLLRIGPIFETRLTYTIDRLVAEFQTTEASLRALNRDLDTASDLIPAGQELCIIPQFCDISRIST